MAKQSNILIPGQLKAGENLLYGEVMEAAEGSKFKPGMRVFYSEYSVSAVHPVGKIMAGDLTMGDGLKEENKMYVVSEDDIMAYEIEGEQYKSAATPMTDEKKQEISVPKN